MSEGGWTLTSVKPLAFGGWAFVIEGPDSSKTLEWWPADTALTWAGRPFLGARVDKPTPRAAKVAAERLVALLNEEQAA